MRLLSCTGDGTFSLTEFCDSEVPCYAILSHTWGPDGEEVTFQEILSGIKSNKPGYDKIRFCGEQAKRDGLSYFWVDTCCINKSDAIELQTAINSMFRWYKNAAKCYVYLVDVSIADDKIKSGPELDYESAFRESRWFTRGWTLQELLAPSLVEFFSADYKRFGDKKCLESLIHEITGIPVKAVQRYDQAKFSFDERVSWVTKRHTKHEEDMVYSLLGIFGVFLPLNYGEGQDNALQRLRDEVEKRFPSQRPAWVVPFERNTCFTGREIELAMFEQKLLERNQTTRIAIIGLGGVGKTQLVLELLYRMKTRYKSCSIIWVQATNMESLHQGYLKIARELGIPGWDDKSTDVKILVREHLSKESTGQWLLVFDNADDIDMWITKSKSSQSPGQGSYSLIDCLPSSRQGYIIFTTRDRKTAVKLAQQNVISLPEMDKTMATILLQKYLVNKDLVNKLDDTIALLAKLTYLPLAIVQAAAYINVNGIAVADYLSLLNEQEEDIIELLSEDFEDTGRYSNVENPVATTWLVSFEQIRRQDPLAADYLSLMSCLDPKGIPQSFLPPGKSRKKEIDAIGMLDAYSFISRRSADQAFDLHRLVHLAMRSWLQKENLLIQTTGRAILRLEEVFPDDDHKNRAIWRIYLPHARFILNVDLVDKNWESRVDLMWRCGNCLYSDGRWDDAEELFAQVKEKRERVLGQEHPSTLDSMGNLASTYRNQGRWKEAEDLDVLVMEMRKRVLGQEHPSTLDSIGNLASTYRNQGRWKEAEDLDVLVMEMRKRVLGQEHPSTLDSMGNLASTYWNQGRWKEAEDLEVLVMETSSRVLGQEHPSTLTSISNLASTYRNQGRWKEAEDLEVLVMETRKRVLGQEYPSTLDSMGNLASTYRNQGRWKEAEDLDVLVMETSSRVLGQEHPSTLTSIGNLASTYWNQGRWKEAEDLDVLVMEMRKRVLGQEHPSTLDSIGNLASTYWNQGRWKEAEDLEVLVMEMRKRVLGQEHPSTLDSIGNLASTYWNQGRWKEAEDLEVLVMETSSRVLGQEHPSTLDSMGNLASTYWNQGRWKEAEDLDVLVMETSSRVLGQEHPSTLTSISNLASTYWNQGRWKEAEDLEVLVMETSSRVLGQEHPSTLTSIGNLASTYWNQGWWKEAEDLEVLVMETSSRVLGQKHPSTLTSMGNLASTYRNQGRWKEAEDLEVLVMETSSRVLGQEHPSTLDSVTKLTLIDQDQSD
ncbi:kinesin light chain 3 [Tricladium varicosporioides]|nr:kinesin light chain 3 [Hymenoscyphus varicosporioides]